MLISSVLNISKCSTVCTGGKLPHHTLYYRASIKSLKETGQKNPQKRFSLKMKKTFEVLYVLTNNPFI